MADRSHISPVGLARMLLKYAKIRREDRGKYYTRVNKFVYRSPRFFLANFFWFFSTGRLEKTLEASLWRTRSSFLIFSRASTTLKRPCLFTLPPASA
jgi:hypothetical protein